MHKAKQRYGANEHEVGSKPHVLNPPQVWYHKVRCDLGMSWDEARAIASEEKLTTTRLPGDGTECSDGLWISKRANGGKKRLFYVIDTGADSVRVLSPTTGAHVMNGRTLVSRFCSTQKSTHQTQRFSPIET